MDKKLFSFLFSTRLMAILFVVFSVAMGVGTFIEDRYNTTTARILIYNAWWFEAIMGIFLINFFGNIKRYQLYKKEKWATLIVHLSFIFILVGAFVTRYISFEGMMPIKEGETVNQIFSDKTYLTALVDGDYNGDIRRRQFEKGILLSPVTTNDFTLKGDFNGIPFEIEYVDFIMNATENVVADENGKYHLKLVESSGGERHEHFLVEGEVQNIHNILYAFNKQTDGAVNIIMDGDDFKISTPFEGEFMRMADQFKDRVHADSLQTLSFRSLYDLSGNQFVIPELPVKGNIVKTTNNDYKENPGITDDVLTVKVKTQGKEELVSLSGDQGKMGEPVAIKLGDLEFTLFFGSKVYETPFNVTLNKFIAEKYPGTQNSYSSFESQVTITDTEMNEKFDARIYMNNVLDYRGYRFFQASFFPDESGTILSVNHDWWGTTITYVGYAFLYVSMILILFLKGSRFVDLKGKLKKLEAKKKSLLTLALLFAGFAVQAQTPDAVPADADHQHVVSPTQPAQAPSLPNTVQIDSLINALKISEEHAAKFARLVIQDEGGRMKPVHTFSSELLRKVSKSDKYQSLNSDQVFVSMTQFPQLWFQVPFVYLKKENDSLHKILEIEKGAKYARLIDFFDARGNYKLAPYLEEAFMAAVPNQFQKDFIEADRKVNLLHLALSGYILKVFPIPYDENKKWVSYPELNEAGFTGIDSTFTKNVIPLYLTSLDATFKGEDYKAADNYLNGLINFQKKYGKEIYPSEEKITAEITYNDYDVFRTLFSWYLYAGLLMFVVVICKIFWNSKFLNITAKLLTGVIIFLFVLHTLGLAARWYISGHAPWSDAYESMIYVAWATMLFGLIFGRKSQLTIASTAFVVAMILMVAHWNWMDPEIANLQAVLNSYWLMIHVAVIVGSYGPFALGMILGIVSLLLMIFTNENNKNRLNLNITEITYINEMALTVGLVMLTIGNFLGGQWANESWGRYWGWDPKETWALISIMTYAFVIHARFVPALRGKWIFNVMSIFAFYVILMTYFGVNFYLSGLHSYASGDKVVTPSFIYYSVAILVVLSTLAYFKHKKYFKK
ncbi:cytochrome c biogenesis protein CcsA [Flavobacterium agricola]|uniref:Cytochrome c biogenesis protein CcsA n=1 Tax=Flavobacterium agricola TaxID=2870839 RepID=A0ABY6M3F5_9FLAO|nr:cytochrome c biogenesis protein CcsA [Flavobacterium agricola]UYW02427.1 cytochrome c biogenesis protein CcsA [Flavobacterium agricola]